jgi:hypothetical protein
VKLLYGRLRLEVLSLLWEAVLGRVIIQGPDLPTTAVDVICRGKEKMKYISNIRITGA